MVSDEDAEDFITLNCQEWKYRLLTKQLNIKRVKTFSCVSSPAGQWWLVWAYFIFNTRMTRISRNLEEERIRLKNIMGRSHNSFMDFTDATRYFVHFLRVISSHWLLVLFQFSFIQYQLSPRYYNSVENYEACTKLFSHYIVTVKRVYNTWYWHVKLEPCSVASESRKLSLGGASGRNCGNCGALKQIAGKLNTSRDRRNGLRNRHNAESSVQTYNESI